MFRCFKAFLILYIITFNQLLFAIGARSFLVHEKYENNENPEIHNTFAIKLWDLDDSLAYTLTVEGTEYHFAIPEKSHLNQIRLYIPLSDDPVGHQFIIKNNTNESEDINGESSYTIKKSNDHLINEYKKLFSQIIIEPILDTKKSYINGFSSLEYLLKIKIDLPDSSFWIDATDSDWQWIYEYIYFSINSTQLEENIISNLINDKINFTLLGIKNTKDGRIYRLYSQPMQDVQIIALLDTYTASTYPDNYSKTIQSLPSEAVSFKESINHTDNKQAIKNILYNIPTYLYVDTLCQYSNEFMNAKLQFEYETSKNTSFTFSQSIPDSNKFDSKLYFFTSAFPFGNNIQIGNIEITIPKEGWRNSLNLFLNFLKSGRIDNSSLNVFDRKIDSLELKAHINDTKQDFDIKDLNCHIDDNNLRIQITCRCSQNL